MVIRRLSSLCRAATDGLPCEDCIGLVERSSAFTGWIIDGATGVSDRPTIPGAETDAAWFAGQLSNVLEDQVRASDESAPLKGILQRAVNSVAEEYRGLIGGRPFRAELVPTASVVLLRARYSHSRWHLETVRLGDCVCVWRDAGTTRVLSSTLSEDFDAEFEQLSHSAEADLQDALVARRRSANLPDGYRIISAKHGSAATAHEDSFQLEGGAKFLLASDGMTRIVLKYRAYTADELLDAIHSDGLDRIYQQLRTIERDDLSRIRFPRVKLHDDASAIFGVLA